MRFTCIRRKALGLPMRRRSLSTGFTTPTRPAREQMLPVSYRVLEMELPYLQGDPEKLRLHRRGVNWVCNGIMGGASRANSSAMEV